MLQVLALLLLFRLKKLKIDAVFLEAQVRNWLACDRFQKKFAEATQRWYISPP